MQDLRNDEGHALVVTKFAGRLCKKLDADKSIVIPAAILHDMGYYGMDKELITRLMEGKLPLEMAKKIKEQHMERGEKFAEKILKDANYESKLIEIIVRIIKNHDSDKECFCIEEKIVRDADKLWRFSDLGFEVDVKRRNITREKWLEYLEGNISKKGYFQTKEARKIAKKELKNIKNSDPKTN
jgi:putative nucleotidyltransferase with HDIG domain